MWSNNLFLFYYFNYFPIVHNLWLSKSSLHQVYINVHFFVFTLPYGKESIHLRILNYWLLAIVQLWLDNWSAGEHISLTITHCLSFVQYNEHNAEHLGLKYCKFHTFLLFSVFMSPNILNTKKKSFVFHNANHQTTKQQLSVQNGFYPMGKVNITSLLFVFCFFTLDFHVSNIAKW